MVAVTAETKLAQRSRKGTPTGRMCARTGLGSLRLEERLKQLEHGGQNPLGSKNGIDGAAPKHAIGEDDEGLDGARNIERWRDAPLRLHVAKQRLKAVDDTAVKAAEAGAHALIARRLQADVDGEAVVLGPVRADVLLPQGTQAPHEVGGAGQRLEPFGEFLPLAVAERRNQGLLAGEVDVKRPGADAGLAADVLHAGAMQAPAGDAAFGGIENVLAPRLHCFGFELWHRRSLHAPQTKRMIVLFAKQSQGRKDGEAVVGALSLKKPKPSPGADRRRRAPQSQKGKQEERASAKKKGTSAAGFGAPSWNIDPAVEGKAMPDLARKRPPAACVP